MIPVRTVQLILILTLARLCSTSQAGHMCSKLSIARLFNTSSERLQDSWSVPMVEECVLACVASHQCTIFTYIEGMCELRYHTYMPIATWTESQVGNIYQVENNNGMTDFVFETK